MSIHDGGEFWRDVARRLNADDGATFNVPRRAPARLNGSKRRNLAVMIVKRERPVSTRKRK